LAAIEKNSDKSFQYYKVFVGVGNNSMLVRTLFKSRYWWLLHDKEEMDKVNFMWTQNRKNEIMNTFRTKFLNIKDPTPKEIISSPPVKRKRNASQYQLPQLGDKTTTID